MKLLSRGDLVLGPPASYKDSDFTQHRLVQPFINGPGTPAKALVAMHLGAQVLTGSCKSIEGLAAIAYCGLIFIGDGRFAASRAAFDLVQRLIAPSPELAKVPNSAATLRMIALLQSLLAKFWAQRLSLAKELIRPALQEGPVAEGPSSLALCAGDLSFHITKTERLIDREPVTDENPAFKAWSDAWTAVLFMSEPEPTRGFWCRGLAMLANNALYVSAYYDFIFCYQFRLLDTAKRGSFVARQIALLRFRTLHRKMLNLDSNFYSALNCVTLAELNDAQHNKLKVMYYYDKAIKMARESGAVLVEAIACERAGAYYLANHNEKIAKNYLKEALEAYKRTNAHKKTNYFQDQFRAFINITEKDNFTFQPRISESIFDSTSFNMYRNTNDILDLDSIMKASQIISKEINYSDLVKKMLKIVSENAGATASYLLLCDNDGARLQIKARFNSDNGETEMIEEQTVNGTNMPLSVIQYVVNAKEGLVLNNIREDDQFRLDPYFQIVMPCSVVALPIMTKGGLIGLFYLENHMVASTFTKKHLRTLKLLCAQSAISIENATYYDDLERKVESRTRDLESAQQKLVDLAHQAGMANMASGMLHKVGNLIPKLQIATEKHFAKVLRNCVVALEKAIQDNPDISNTLLIIEVSLKEMEARNAQFQESIQNIAAIVQSQARYSHSERFLIHVDLKSEIEDIVHRQLANEIRDKRIHVTIAVELSKVPAEKYKMVFILEQVIQNAIESFETITDDRIRQITIHAFQKDQDVVIEVRDNGCGIPTFVLPNIFNMGYTTRRNALGIGLHEASNFAISMEGKMRAESAGTNKGTTIFITFPMAPRAV